MDRILFVVGLCALSFVYGVATMEFHIFPFSVLKGAKLGIAAWAGIDRTHEDFPKAFESFEPDAAASPQAKRLDRGAGNEYILVTGGPYQMMDRCPHYGCMAWVTHRTGRVLHTWEVNLDELWNGLSSVSGPVNKRSLYPVGMQLGKDGSLVVTFQGRETYPVHIGIIKVDVNGRILWKRFDRSHHWPAMDAKGNIYTPFSVDKNDLKYIGRTSVNVLCKTGETDVDAIRRLSPDGKPLRVLPIMDAFLNAGLHGWFYNVRSGCNPVHLNSIDIASPAVAAAIPGVQPGDLLISLRETNTVALLDGRTGAVKYVVAGQTAAQHSPHFLPDGTVLVFDNRGGDRALGGSRIVRVDLVKRTATTVFPRRQDGDLTPFYSETAGHIDVSQDGKRALVADTHQGRVIELEIDSGKPLWTYDNTQDIGRYLKERALRSKTTRARFAVYGAYYVRSIDFLKEHP